MRDTALGGEQHAPAFRGAGAGGGIQKILARVVFADKGSFGIARGKQAAAGITVCTVQQNGGGTAAQQRQAAVGFGGGVAEYLPNIGIHVRLGRWLGARIL